MKGSSDGTNLVSIKACAGVFVTFALLVSVEFSDTAAQQMKQPWRAPGSVSQIKNPVKPSPEGLKAAEQLYQQNCVICHGQTGASNGPAAGSLPQKPANFTNVQMMKKATDGELFWKISTGRAPMPSWQDRLSETQRWQLVNYLRELTKKGRYKYLGIGTGVRG
jgi:mono/diheme cytochrome c family protein